MLEGTSISSRATANAGSRDIVAHGSVCYLDRNAVVEARPRESNALTNALAVQAFPARTATAAFKKNCRVPILGKDHNARRRTAGWMAPFATFR